MSKTIKCCFCNKEIEEVMGNNARPVKEGTCCDGCNAKIVIPARIADMEKHQCIFEKRYCEYADKRRDIFNCTAPSDEAMTCR